MRNFLTITITHQGLTGEPQKGTNILSVVSEALQYSARENGKPFTFTFNGVELSVTSSSDFDKVVNTYYQIIENRRNHA